MRLFNFDHASINKEASVKCNPGCIFILVYTLWRGRVEVMPRMGDPDFARMPVLGVVAVAPHVVVDADIAHLYLPFGRVLVVVS